MSVLDTSISVSYLRSLCQAYSDPNTGVSTSAPNFYPWLTEALFRLNDEGLWKGVGGEVAFNGAPYGYVTLPWRYESVMGAAFGNVPVNTFSQYNAYKDMGLGPRKPNAYNQQGFSDMGDGFCTQIDINPDYPSLLTIISNPADAGKVIRFYGNGPNSASTPYDSTIYDESGDSATGSEGIQITTGTSQVSTSVKFSEITRIQVGSPMKYPWQLWANVYNPLPPAGQPNNQYLQIGYYEPTELAPQRRRWKTGVINFPQVTSPTQDCPAIRMFCKRRVIPPVYETDMIFPGAPYAICLAFQAIRYEKVIQKPEQAKKYWELAIENLDAQIKSARGNIKLSVPFRMGYPSLPQQTF